jgi:predicted ATP-grasp superfamily ATP-dependent carboligase
MTDSVLVPTGTQLKSYACMRSLNRRGIRTVVASEHESLPHFSSRYCSERVRLSSPPSDVVGYRDDLLALARRPDVRTVVPVRECDAYVLAKYGAAFEDHVSLVSPDLETLRRGHDRLALAAAAEAADVPVARTRSLGDVEEWNTDVVVKSRYNVLTDEYVDTYPADTLAEMKRVQFLRAGEEPDVAAIRRAMDHEPIVQEFVPQADKHLYCALWDEGEPLATYQHRQIRQNSWVGGGGVYRKSVHSETVDALAHDLLTQLDWHGFACIEYVKDARTGEWKFLEINPRVWQSMPEAVRAGADFPAYYWQCARGEAERIELSYEDGQACHIAYGELSHLLSVRRDESPFREPPSFTGTAWRIATSCLRHPRFDYIRRDDPRLILSAVRRLLSTGVTRSRDYDGGGSEYRSGPVSPDTEPGTHPTPVADRSGSESGTTPVSDGGADESARSDPS